MQVKEGIITGSEPVTVDEVKTYCRIDYATEDALIADLITGVREQIERFTGLSIIEKSLTYFDEEIDEEIFLPYPDHNAITEVKVNGEAITSYTQTGLTQKIIYPGTTFTTTLADNKGIQITYTTTGNCPKGIKIEMLRLLAEKYRVRGNTFEGAIVELDENSYANLAQFCKQ